MASSLYDVFRTEPGIGFAIVDQCGRVRTLNECAARLYVQGHACEVEGRCLGEIFEPETAAAGMELLGRAWEGRRPLLVRCIRNGVQVRTSIRPIDDPEDDVPVVLVIAVEGSLDAAESGSFESCECPLAQFGPLDRLSKRELEVLALIGRGMTTDQIAGELHRSPRTIERHCDSLRRKLEASNRIQLAEFASRAGLRVQDACLKRVD